MALALTTGTLTSIPVAHADPVDQDGDTIVEVTTDIDADANVSSVAETSDESVDADVTADADVDADVDVDTDAATTAPAVDSTQDATAPTERVRTTDASQATTSSNAPNSTAAAVDADSDAALDTAAVTGLSVNPAAKAAAGSFSSMRLRRADGIWVTITPQMQANALVVMNTIKNTSWAGVSLQDRERLTVIALMTMAQESTFYTHPTAHVPDRNQDVGPFQQRSKVGWYADGRTQAENIKILNNIPYATRTFIEGHRVPRSVSGGAGPKGYIIPGVFQMKGSKDWRKGQMWEVAANVQRPAAQYRYHYEYWRPVVQSMVNALKGQTSGSTAQPSDVYTTPGEHTVDGRKWRTTCESYSKTIKRCRATIWATTVSFTNGKFVQKNGWQFNNLTYLPSKRAQWKGNPLAQTGTFTSAGRQWRTSCNDAWTGPKGCRSFMQAYVIESYLDATGNRRFREVKKEVFNNVVRFSN